jgi:excisionase family DNA binding protein
MSALLSVDEAALTLNVSTRTIRRRLKAGLLEYHEEAGRRGGRSGRVFRIPEESLHRLQHESQRHIETGSVTPPIDLSAFRIRGGVDAVREAAARLKLIDYARSITGPKRTEKLKELAKSVGVSPATLYRWMDLKGKHEHTLEATAKTMRRPKFDGQGMRFRTSIEPEARDFFLAAWNAENRPLVSSVIDDVYKPEARKRGWKIPSKSTFYRIVKQDLSKVEKKAGREGRQALRSDTLPKNTLLYPKQRNLAWASDHRVFDFFVLNPETGKPDRLWLTQVLDMGSRSGPGWALTFKPNSESILEALNMAIYAEAPFEPAIPRWILTDNGQDYRSDLVRGFIAAIGSKQRLCEPYSGWQKGFIESFFKLPSGHFDRYFGWAGNNVLVRPADLDEKQWAEGDRIYTVEEVRACWIEFMRWYHFEHQHTGDGMDGKTPAQRYAELPSAEIGVPATNVMPLLMMKEETRKVTSEGIRIWNKILFHPALYSHDNTIHRSVADETVTVRFHPEDESMALVFFEGQFVCKVTDKVRPTFAPDDEENMRTAGQIRNLSKKLERDTMERLHARAERAGHNPWIPDRVPEKKTTVETTAKAPRRITPMDGVAKQLEAQERQDARKRERDDEVSRRLQEIGGRSLA